MKAADYLTMLARQPRRLPRATPRDGLHELLATMGHPERRLRCIHVVGSKGKGSTALMLDGMLRAGGRETGVFTSPHFERWNERILMNGAPVDDMRFDAILAELRPHVSALHERCARGPDFFEVLLVAALCLFERAGVDEAIVEAGIGARFDATMVVQPVVTVLTSVELEHTDVLGADLAAIAEDKAAVARPGVPLVLGWLPPAAREVVVARADAVGAAVTQPHVGFRPGRAAVVVDGGHRLPLPAASRAQANCAAAALHCLCALRLFAAPVAVARHGMASVRLPGRLESLARRPLLIADSAHTQASVAVLVELLQSLGVSQRPLHAVLSCSGQRDVAALLAPLLVHADHVIVTCADPDRSADPRLLAAALRPVCPVAVPLRIVGSPRAALVAAVAQAPAHGIVCATGSVYMAGAARRCKPAAG